MQIPPTAALLNVIAALPAGAAGAVRPPAPAQPMQPARSALAVSGPPALAAAQKALAARANTAVVTPEMGAAPAPNLPRGSIINIVV